MLFHTQVFRVRLTLSWQKGRQIGNCFEIWTREYPRLGQSGSKVEHETGNPGVNPYVMNNPFGIWKTVYTRFG